MTDLMHKAEIQQLVRDAYSALDAPGAPAAAYYDAEQLAWLPPGAVAWALGVGNPMAHAVLPPGSTVLDVGCGVGHRRAARRPRGSGPTGRVIGLDLLPEMCERARANAARGGTARTSRSSKARWRRSRCPTTPSTRSSPTA